MSGSLPKRLPHPRKPQCAPTGASWDVQTSNPKLAWHGPDGLSWTIGSEQELTDCDQFWYPNVARPTSKLPNSAVKSPINVTLAPT